MKKLMFILGAVFSISGWANTNETISPLNYNTQPKAIVVDTPASFFQDDYAVWMGALEKLQESNIQEITLRISGLGGVLYYESQVARKIQQLQNDDIKINMVVDGRAISGNAYIVCFASSYTVMPNSVLYFHPGATMTKKVFGQFIGRDSSKTRGDGIGDEIDMQFNYNQCIKSGVLTKQDVDSLKDGKNVMIVTDSSGKQTKSIGYFDNEELFDINIKTMFDLLINGIIVLFGIVLLILLIKRIK